MYVREKKIRRGEKTYSYWQLVQGTRVDGKVRQKVVAHLGDADDRERADVYARAKGLMCGAVGCGGRGVAEHAACFVEDWRKAERTVLLCPDHGERFRSGERLAAVTLESP
jgi:hypothetical protein